MNTRSIPEHSFTDWVRGQQPTAEDMLALYESEFLVRFATTNMNGDAFAHWIKDFEEPNPKAPLKPKLIQAMDWSTLYGDAIVVLLEKAPENGKALDLTTLEKPFTGKPLGLDVFHPIVDGDGYDDPAIDELDPVTGIPKFLTVHVKGLRSEGFKIDISRIVIFAGLKTRRSWRGQYIAIASLDDQIDYRKWRSAYGARSHAVAEPTFHLDKPTPNGEWTTAEKTSVDSAFGVDKAALTTGGVTMNPISQPLAIGELDATAIGLLNAVANDLGVMLNDLFQNQGNAEKVAPDSNQTAYIQALIDRQRLFTDPITQVLEAFGMTFDGWNSPWEEPFAQQLTNISTLAGVYNNSQDPEIRSVAKALLMSEYGEKTTYKTYLAAERANVEREQRIESEFVRGAANGGTQQHARA